MPNHHLLYKMFLNSLLAVSPRIARKPSQTIVASKLRTIPRGNREILFQLPNLENTCYVSNGNGPRPPWHKEDYAGTQHSWTLRLAFKGKQWPNLKNVGLAKFSLDQWFLTCHLQVVSQDTLISLERFHVKLCKF